jgi:hypothetical protein
LIATIDASLLGWLGQKYESEDIKLLLVATSAAAVLTASVVWMNAVAYRRIRALEKL